LSKLSAELRAVADSGLFDEDAYRRTYLRASPFRRWPALHYATIGEKLGYRPNAFFDPCYYRSQIAAVGDSPDGLLLSFYAEHGAGRAEAPSREFDHAWYAWQNPDWAREAPPLHPLRHMLRVGLRELRDPSPRIELRRLIASLCPAARAAPAEALLRLAISRGGLLGCGVTRDLQELRARQSAFRERLNYDVLRRGRPGRRDLVYVQSGRGVHPPYLVPARGFDVLRNYYADPTGEVCPHSDHVLFQRGSKVTSVAAILRRDPELLLAYDQVLFLDDDIALEAGAVESFFAAMRRHGAVLAQPLLTPESDCVWPLFKDSVNTGRCVPVSSVEVMMPAFSRDALVRLAWTFGLTVSGFGVDLLWGHLLPEARRAGRVLLIGEVQARHERTIDDVGGAFYLFMAENGINPKLELWMVLQEYGLVPSFHPLADKRCYGAGGEERRCNAIMECPNASAER
jgi:hypothetical protein